MWKDDPPTEKQISAVLNMRRVFDINKPLPKTKGEASEEIGKLKSTIQNNVSISGYANPEKSALWNMDDDEAANCFGLAENMW